MKLTNPLRMFRLVCCFAFICVGALLFGPFGGAESLFGLTDKEAHSLAFFGLTSVSLLAAPRLRKLEVALLLIGFGGLSELIQSLVGRDGEVMDWIADSAGVVLALVPMYFERLRQNARGEKIVYPRRRRSDKVLGSRTPHHGRHTSWAKLDDADLSRMSQKGARIRSRQLVRER